MANKFTQSVLQRLEQEAAKQKADTAATVPPAEPLTKTVSQPKDTKAAGQGRGSKKAPAAPKAVKPKDETPTKTPAQPAAPAQNHVGASVPDRPQAQPPTQPPAETTPAAPAPDLSAYLDLRPARQAKNKTFYLDVEVIDAITHAARAQGLADSKLVNDILRRVLGVDG